MRELLALLDPQQAKVKAGDALAIEVKLAKAKIARERLRGYERPPPDGIRPEGL